MASDIEYIKVEIDVDEAWVDPLETMLTAVGAVTIELADAADEPILEPAPGATPLWQRVRLTALFEPTIGETEIRLAVASAVEPGALPPVTFGVVADEDWVVKLRDELVPLRFGENLWVCPTGKDCPDPSGTAITMEPGLAFGTGSHPTTALCMDWLAMNPPAGRTLLDFGCGSGILGIAALALGATSVAAVDIDEQALTATRQNARRNPGSDRLTVLQPAELEEARKYGVVVANILSGTLIELAPVLRNHGRTGTTIALSGILTTQAGAVADAYCGWCDIDVPVERDGWVLLTGTVI